MVSAVFLSLLVSFSLAFSFSPSPFFPSQFSSPFHPRNPTNLRTDVSSVWTWTPRSEPIVDPRYSCFSVFDEKNATVWFCAEDVRLMEEVDADDSY